MSISAVKTPRKRLSCRPGQGPSAGAKGGAEAWLGLFRCCAVWSNCRATRQPAKMADDFRPKSVKDVPADQFITAFAAYLKQTNKVRGLSGRRTELGHPRRSDGACRARQAGRGPLAARKEHRHFSGSLHARRREGAMSLRQAAAAAREPRRRRCAEG